MKIRTLGSVTALNPDTDLVPNTDPIPDTDLIPNTVLIPNTDLVPDTDLIPGLASMGINPLVMELPQWEASIVETVRVVLTNTSTSVVE